MKRQLLAEIADLVQLEGRELGELWEGKRPGSQRRDDGERRAWRRPEGYAAPVRRSVRTQPMNRGTRALQILFLMPQAWELLSHDEHHLLVEMPAPYGPLFAWLDSQHHDHGPQSWEALREACKPRPAEFSRAEMARCRESRRRPG